MEKGPSEFAEFWTSPYNELYHFYAHGDEFGFTLLTEYSESAIEFANSEDDGKMSFVSENGEIYMYNPGTNEFLILSRDGKIITYFPPENGIDYFYDQFEKFGDYWIE